MASLTYVIVGAGVFGTSTALQIKRKYPEASVLLVDRNGYEAVTRTAASWDWNKVVRADYRDPTYMRLALEACELWRTDPLWAPFYREAGIFWASRTSFASEDVANYAAMGASGGGGGGGRGGGASGDVGLYSARAD